jgi:glyoxylase-like metal-dependent hydrolase (beta-lactamase superfamily II)
MVLDTYAKAWEPNGCCSAPVNCTVVVVDEGAEVVVVDAG